ncbi:E3 ubiquitin-protein ligase RGLG2 [Aphelenchoides avenae]|nr:E3 ubiquitin-protein ligase RGLG2 [Aphelenchus avenae]
MIWQMSQMCSLKTATNDAFKKREECQRKQLCRLDDEARKHAQDVDRLSADADATQMSLKQMTTAINACAKRLASLSAPSKKAKNEKPLDAADVLTSAVSNAERAIKVEQERTKLLERKLSDAMQKLDAMRTAYSDVFNKVLDVEAQLNVAVKNGTTLAKKCDEQDKKICCPICLDREKNVTFACGHAYCVQCATEWKTCAYNCKRPNSGKPVQFRYPLFLG